ncbi:hypothetical protein E8E11_002194 [Didymella keratinophila]|nr:hypothetical protein E8E11_002194 [Didymella keratinophila]
MCLYHYLYFSACQHGELTLISYCDKAKALGLANTNSPSLRGVGNASKQRSTSLPSPLSASNYNASHSHSQQHQHPNMATLSSSKPRTMCGCGPTPVHHERSSPQRAAFVPRSALSEPGYEDPVPASPSSVSLSAMQAIQAFKGRVAHDGTFLLSAEESRQDPTTDAISFAKASVRSGRGSDEETVQGSSEASVDIITERDTLAYSDVRSASPRKPLPAQWFPPSQSPMVASSQRARAHGGTQASTSGSPVDHRPLRTTRSSVDSGKAHANTTSYLTKEALDAVDANITSPPLRRSPSKAQRSPTKVPWNSPTVSPKVRSLRHRGTSPAKPSPPRVMHLGVHVTAHHRRAPSSIVSTGATSFHTAHGSPVRSSACSQSSFSSAEDLNDSVYFHCSDYVADVDVEQVDRSNDKGKASATPSTTTSLRSRVSRPELKIRIPPPGTTLNADRNSALTFTSATSSTAVSVRQINSPGIEHAVGEPGAISQSRIPRMSISKGSSALAPTLSSTLKQTKSTHTLRSQKASTGKPEQKFTTTSKAAATKPLRHVRTVDSTGATPILSNRRSRDFSIPASVASIATTNTQRTTRAGNIDLLTSYLQDTALEAAGPPEDPEDLPLPPSCTASRATSSSTVKASQIPKEPAKPDSPIVQSSKASGFSGNVHSSDADDEYNDSTTSLPIRGRSAQYQPPARRATISEVSMQSSSTSDLRATASEFVPTVKDASTSVAGIQPLSSLPDLYALDGYGIPWFYHMYPVPWIFPTTFNKIRSKSPKKLKSKKQRSAIDLFAVEQKGRPEMNGPTHSKTVSGVTDGTASALNDSRNHNPASQGQTTAAASGDRPATAKQPYLKPSDGPFSSQLDEIARQAALQPKTNIVQPPGVDLMTIRNVSTQDDYAQVQAQGYNTVPSRRRNQRHTGNGLYGGRGNVGMPLYATAPFPMPVPPMGKPIEQSGGSHAYFGYPFGNQGCGTVNIDKAAESGGVQACNTCKPDH